MNYITNSMAIKSVYGEDEIIIESIDDLYTFLSDPQAPDYTVIKFYADWCKPCQRIGDDVDKLVNMKLAELSKVSRSTLCFIKLNIDCADELYFFMKDHRVLNCIPSMLVYDKSIYIENISRPEATHLYRPQQAAIGSDMKDIEYVLDLIK